MFILGAALCYHINRVRISIAYRIALCVSIFLFYCFLDPGGLSLIYSDLGRRAILSLVKNDLSSISLAPGVGAMASSALDLRECALPRVVAAALGICFAYLVVTLYCVWIATSYSAVICLLLALCLALTGELLLLLVNLLLELDDACLDPRVLEGLLWSHPLFHLPLKALVDEVNEEIVITLHHLC